MMASSSGPLPTVVPRDLAGSGSPLVMLTGNCWNVLIVSTLGLALGDLSGVSCFNGSCRTSCVLAYGRLATEDLRLAGARGEGW